MEWSSRGEHQSPADPRVDPTERPAPPGILEVPMQSEHPVILLVGSDPDILFLRSAVLASAGIWSLRVRNADQAIDVLGNVACDLAVICYMLDENDQQRLLRFLLLADSGLKVLWMVPGDDCSGTGFLMKVQEALEGAAPMPPAIMEPPSAYSRMVR